MDRPTGGAVPAPHATAHGAEWTPERGTQFRLWAPAHARIDLVLEGRAPLPMVAEPAGWHTLTLADAGPGTRYRFRLPDGLLVPDPASRFQPEDVHGPSEIVDSSSYVWQDHGWAGRPWTEAVIYELHIGTFTPEGTFRGAIGKLDHLAALGVTAIEIMPVADFAGRRNWGYDGVLLYAPDSAYGRPDDFKALVDAAHRRNISVILDVVYNHFGPDGNYLSTYAPGFFTERHHTPWGAAVNYDGPDSRPVRDFAIQNALYWVEAFHLDGLRLDAVHAILDDGEPDLLTEMAERLRSAVTARPLHLILENEDNVASRLRRLEGGAPARYTAQWNDDVHHVLHVAASGESKGYYADYLGDTDKLGRALAEGFAFQGEVMPYRGSVRGEPTADLPPQAFVAFIQNHDQIGNRAFGDRITEFCPPAAVRAIAATALLSPQIPMLFMGEEWGSACPFPFFCDFTGDLAEAVRKGRREEFKRFPEFEDEATRMRIPDPLAQTTFDSAKLDWDAIRTDPHAGTLAWYRRIIGVRHSAIMPLLAGMRGGESRYRLVGDAAVTVRWATSSGCVLMLDLNLKAVAQPGFDIPAADPLWLEGSAAGGQLGAWSVRWTIIKESDV